MHTWTRGIDRGWDDLGGFWVPGISAGNAVLDVLVIGNHVVGTASVGDKLVNKVSRFLMQERCQVICKVSCLDVNPGCRNRMWIIIMQVIPE